MNNLLWNNKIAAKEHAAVRTTAGWYYFTHHIIEVEGPDAATLLDYVYTNDIAGLAVGRARYTMMLGLDGVAQDDCIIFRIEDQKYWISTLHRPRTLVALTANKGDKDVDFRSRTEELDMYAVQGPRAKELVNAVVANPVDDYKFFSIHDNKLGDIDIKVARAGYTGEKWGYEIYSAAENHEAVEEALRAASPEFDALQVTTLDVMAYTLATEAGLVLVPDIDRSTPFECGMERYIKWDKEFVGKEQALAAKDAPKKLHMWGITVDQKDARLHGGPYGAPVKKDGKEIGRVSKYTFGFTVDKGVGFILVDEGSIQPGDEVILNWDTVAKVCELPILKR